ncbi:MAG: PIN domain-containing protein [Armatimonadota bacterium]|nr:PIN domain-containing protein [Armatimonadota bacterium]
MSRDVEVYSIDANVMLRFLVGDDPKLYRKAFDIITGIESGRNIAICDPVNLAEVVWVMKSFYKLSNERIHELLEPILNVEGFLLPNKERYLLALRLFAEGMRSFGDACACAAAIQDCGGRLYSFDEKLSNAQGVTRCEG